MSYYDETAAYAARGIDYDLYACLNYNPQEGYSVHDIAKVLAVIEGENDGPPWYWVLELNDGRIIYLNGSCDYTGWDCQSGADSTIFNSGQREFRIRLACGEIMRNLDIGPFDDRESAGKAVDKAFTVRDSLLAQAFGEKARTWREAKDKEFGLR